MKNKHLNTQWFYGMSVAFAMALFFCSCFNSGNISVRVTGDTIAEYLWTNNPHYPYSWEKIILYPDHRFCILTNGGVGLFPRAKKQFGHWSSYGKHLNLTTDYQKKLSDYFFETKGVPSKDSIYITVLRLGTQKPFLPPIAMWLGGNTVVETDTNGLARFHYRDKDELKICLEHELENIKYHVDISKIQLERGTAYTLLWPDCWMIDMDHELFSLDKDSLIWVGGNKCYVKTHAKSSHPHEEISYPSR